MRRNDFFKSLLFSGGSAASRSELETETLPYTFNSNSYKLRNYRIYGNTVNEESVGDLVTEGEHAGEYCVPVTITNGSNTQTTNIYLPEQIRKVGDETEYIDYKEQKQHKVRKNLFDFSSWADSLVYTTRISYNITGNIITLNATSNDAFTSPYSHATGGFEIPVNPNTTYILSWQSDNNNSGLVYVFENGVLSGNQMHSVNNSSQKSMRFTTLPDTRFLTFRLGVSNIGDSIAYFNIQLELGSVITPYLMSLSPHSRQQQEQTLCQWGQLYSRQKFICKVKFQKQKSFRQSMYRQMFKVYSRFRLMSCQSTGLNFR